MISDDNLLQEFISESREHIASIEPDLLLLEQDGEMVEPEVINRIFRAIHSIKGASGFFGLEALKQMSHVMESVLMLFRDGKLKPNPAIVGELLAGTDKLQVMLDDIEQSESVPYQEIAERLEIFATGGTPANSAAGESPVQQSASQAEVATTPTPRITADQPEAAAAAPPSHYPSAKEYESAHRSGQTIYTIEVRVFEDWTERNRKPCEFVQLLESLGRIFHNPLDHHPEPAENETLLFCLATVLELDLLVGALDLPPERITELAMNHEPAATSENAPDAPVHHPVSSTDPAADPKTAPENPTQKISHREEQMTTTQALEHAAEGDAQAGKTKGKGSAASLETVRVRVDLLNNLMNLAGEMVLLRNQLTQTLKDRSADIDGLPAILQNLNLTTSDLQEHIMQTRMQPIGNIFSKFRRVVRDLAQQLGKKIDLEIIGEDVELDKSLVESLSDPLTHLIRNCCDHGLETPEERERAGKSSTGRIVLHAYHEGGQINIAIQDNGRGIDPDRIARKALDMGLYSQVELDRMSPKEIVNIIMAAGFSTASAVTDISGRGVGMDVVRTNIEKLGGNISIDSQKGSGTTILLKLPLTLAIIPSLIVGVESFRFAIPQLNLVELICIRSHEINQKIEKVGSVNVLRLRGKLLPLVRLADVLDIERYYEHPETGEQKVDRRQAIADRRARAPHPEIAEMEEDRPDYPQRGEERRKNLGKDFYIAILRMGSNQYGLLVDSVINLEEIVVKPLSNYLKSCQCFTASTIMGDGRVVMILDVTGIAHYAKLSFNDLSAEAQLRESALESEMDSDVRRYEVILFNNGNDEIFAVPLSSVLRLEKFKFSDIQQVGEQEFLPYRGKGMPLIRLDHYLPIQSMNTARDDAYMIIPKDGDCEAGIIATEILDALTVEVHLQEIFEDRQKGVEGAAIVNGRMTIFLNPSDLLARAGITADNLAPAL